MQQKVDQSQITRLGLQTLKARHDGDATAWRVFEHPNDTVAYSQW